MKSSTIAFMTILATGAAFLSTRAVIAQPDKEADLSARVAQLEKRVAELEKIINKSGASPAEPPRTEMEKSLIGTWQVVDADKKQSVLTDVKLKGNETCGVALNADGRTVPDAKYSVIGNKIKFVVPLDLSATAIWDLRIASVTETELVMEQNNGDGTFVKIHYTRAK